jgi:hypothetical protein
MQKDYQAEMQKMQEQQQSKYQQTRDPFEYGKQVAQRRYSEIMSGLNNQNIATQQTYGDLYQQAQRQSVKGNAAGGPRLSGGMGQQQQDYTSAIEMEQMARIQQGGEAAGRDLFTQAQSAMANSELEGQQATQIQLQNEQAALQRIQQSQAIINSELSTEDKRAQLEAMGVDTSRLDVKKANTGLIGGWEKIVKGEASASEMVGTVLTTAAIAYGGYKAFQYAPKIAAFFKTKLGGGVATTGTASFNTANILATLKASGPTARALPRALPPIRPVPRIPLNPAPRPSYFDIFNSGV